MRNSRRIQTQIFISVIALGFCGLCYADVEITLKRAFIEKYKNKVTVTSDFFVDKAHRRPNASSKDGDLHVAGRSPEEIQLPIVAEVMNAKDQSSAVDKIHEVEGSSDSVNVTGVWRLWCEHAGEPQIQGTALTAFDTTNPDHVFEIHPIIKLDGEELLDSLKPIQGYKTKDAESAFLKYENQKSRIMPGSTTTTIITPMAGYNYAEFIMQAYTDKQFVVEDGRFVYANVLDLEENILAYKRRMVFVKDTEPEEKVKNLKKGECIHVVGIPRIDLALVSWRTRNVASKPEALTWTLPYEMVVVAVYDDQPCQNQ